MIVRRITVLDPSLANKIAAGEVVERPASVVKELVENSLDAGASSVTVEIREGGAEYIRVMDNGCGIPEEDVKTAFLRHATSKLVSAEGLDGIETLGFRGEALASIAAVSRVTMRTRTENAEAGTSISIDGGTVKECLPCGCPFGTNIEVRELFYNVPARLKFLKSARAEAAAAGDYLLRLILGNTNVSFKFINNGKPVYHSAGDGSLENAVSCVYGADVTEHLRSVRYDDGYILIEGFCGDEFISRSNRIHQSIFVNGRYIRSQQLSYAAQRAYDTKLTVGRFPFLAVNVKISPREVDVNVHPNKLTVRFRDEERVSNAMFLAVRDALSGNTLFADDERFGAAAGIKPPEEQGRADLYKAFGIPNRKDGGALTVETPLPAQPDTNAVSASSQTDHKHDSAPNPFSFGGIKPDFTPETAKTVYVKDSGSSPAALEASDVNGLNHYVFIPEEKPAAEKSEAIEFDISPYVIVGTVFDTYIIVEQNDSVFFIDQHAAHERILYEKLIRSELKFESQLLLTAKVVTLSPTDCSCLLENIERFRELGFEIEEFGATSVSIHAVPNGIRIESVEKLLHDMIEIIRLKGGVSELDLLRGSLIQSSCKHAIKAGMRLDDRGIRELLSHYADGSTPLTCPHGRPVMLSMSRRDFEKMFKRIQ